jgi:hypothetical protein
VEEKSSPATPTISSAVGEVKRTTPTKQLAGKQLSGPTAVEISEVTSNLVAALPAPSAKNTALRWFSHASSPISSARGEHSTASSVEPGGTWLAVTASVCPSCRPLVGVTTRLGMAEEVELPPARA